MSTTTNKNLTAASSVSAVLEMPSPPGAWAVQRRLTSLFRGVWSATNFPETEVTEYAEREMLNETRKGITLMAVVSLLIQVSAVTLYQKLGIHGSILYTYGLLSLLSLHIVVSARFIHDTKALNLLGTLLLVVTGVAIMAIAHRSGTLNAGLLSSIVLLFMVVPLVPWGLREASIVVALIYATFTVSSLSVEGRFEPETLWTLQFLIVASAVVATMIIVRATAARKHNIRTRYELEKTHEELELISTRDPLTGAWNRRFLKQNFKDIAERAREAGNNLYLALLDIDKFKHLNDTYGHHHGDEILKKLAQVLNENLPGTAYVLRLGGDEFAVLGSGEGFEQSVRRCLEHLETDPHLLEVDSAPVRVSTGFAKSSPETVADLDRLYHIADKALYARKNARRMNQASGLWHAIPV